MKCHKREIVSWHSLMRRKLVKSVKSRAQEALVAQRGEKSKFSLEDLFEQIQEGDVKEINIIVKADVQGSVEAMAASLR